MVESGFLALMPESMAVAEPNVKVLDLHLDERAQQVGLLPHRDRPLTPSAAWLADKLREAGAEMGARTCRNQCGSPEEAGGKQPGK